MNADITGLFDAKIVRIESGKIVEELPESDRYSPDHPPGSATQRLMALSPPTEIKASDFHRPSRLDAFRDDPSARDHFQVEPAFVLRPPTDF